MIAAALLLAVVAIGAAAVYWYPTGGFWTLAGLMALYLGVEVVVRPALLISRIERPFPDAVFRDVDLGPLITTVLAIVVLWIVVFGAASWALPGNRSSLRSPRYGDVSLVERLALVLTLLAFVAFIALWIRFEGPVGLAEAVKQRKDRVPLALRALPVLGAFAAVAAALVAPWRSARQGLAVLLYLLCAALAFSGGSRDAAVFPLLLILVIRPGTPHFTGSRVWIGTVLRVLLVAALVVSVMIPLRYLRDTILYGEPASTIQSGSPIRNAAVAGNLTSFDALMLLHLNHEEVQAKVSIVDFARPVLPGDAGRQQVAVVIAQSFDPDRRSGFPTTPIGEWYAALGRIGVVIGAGVSALFAAGISWVLHRIHRVDGALAMIILMLTATLIAAGGVWSYTLYRSIIYFGTLGLAVALTVGLTHVARVWRQRQGTRLEVGADA